jgi:hypothetical protein
LVRRRLTGISADLQRAEGARPGASLGDDHGVDRVGVVDRERNTHYVADHPYLVCGVVCAGVGVFTVIIGVAAGASLGLALAVVIPNVILFAVLGGLLLGSATRKAGYGSDARGR